MLVSYIPSGTLLLVIFGIAEQCLTPSSSIVGRCLITIFCMPTSVQMIIFPA